MSFAKYRIELGEMGHHTRVYDLSDGRTRDISSQISGLELSSHVGEVNRLKLHMPGVGGTVTSREAHPSDSSAMVTAAYREARQ